MKTKKEVIDYINIEEDKLCEGMSVKKLKKVVFAGFEQGEIK